jgi:hypothetical protein
MAGRGTSRTQEARRRIAVEAARLMSEGGLRDYRQAKEKAAARLGILDESSLPKNSEIENALREYQRLFHADDQPRALRRLREAAREAMRFFANHEPRLVGAVLDGTADEHSAVCLHLYTDQPHAVLDQLRELRAAYDEQSRRVRIDRAAVREYPALRFVAGETPIDLTVLPYDMLRQAPLDRVNDKPMQRATLALVDALLGAPAIPG